MRPSLSCGNLDLGNVPTTLTNKSGSVYQIFMQKKKMWFVLNTCSYCKSLECDMGHTKGAHVTSSYYQTRGTESLWNSLVDIISDISSQFITGEIKHSLYDSASRILEICTWFSQDFIPHMFVFAYFCFVFYCCHKSQPWVCPYAESWDFSQWITATGERSWGQITYWGMEGHVKQRKFSTWGHLKSANGQLMDR